MNSICRWALAAALLLAWPLAGLGQDLPLTTEGKIPGQPFQYLQQQVDELRFDVDSIELKEGPPGPTGPPGPPGPPGEPGGSQLAEQGCPPGLMVTGFDASGNIICTGQRLGGGIVPQMPLYDDFSGPGLDPAKWNPHTSGGCSLYVDPATGTLSSNLVFSGSKGTCGAMFTQPMMDHSFMVDVTVTEYAKDTGVVHAQVSGEFFNTSMYPTGRSGDVRASVSLSDFDPVTGIGVVRWWVAMCANDPCNVTTVFGWGNLDSVKLGETRTIGIRWEPMVPTTLMLFVDGVQPLVFDVLPFIGTGYAMPAFMSFREVRTVAATPSYGNISATFDNVGCADMTGMSCPTY